MRIGDHIDPVGSAVWSLLDYDTATLECRRLIELMACIPCSPYSGTIATVNTYSTTVRVCSSFCGLVYDLCGDAQITNSNDTLDTFYTSSLDMCYNMLVRRSLSLFSSPSHPLTNARVALVGTLMCALLRTIRALPISRRFFLFYSSIPRNFLLRIPSL